MYLRVVCLVDWHLEVFYCPYYKIKNARMHELISCTPTFIIEPFFLWRYAAEEDGSWKYFLKSNDFFHQVYYNMSAV